MKALTVTLIGTVNAGKTFLHKRLLKRPKDADVSPRVGWTREIDVFPYGDGVVLADTPGLEDPEESVAQKTFDFLGQTDIFLHVINAHEGVTLNARLAHDRMHETGRPVIVVCNRAGDLDTSDRQVVSEHVRKSLNADTVVLTDAKTEEGIEDLSRAIMARVQQDGDELRFARFCAPEIEEVRRRLDRASVEADSAIHWGTGRAATIAVVPIPLADVYPLVANQIYMAKKIGDAYGLELTDSVIKGLMGAMGASFAGLLIATWLPGLKIAIAASITFGVGKAIKTWCSSDGRMSESELRAAFKKARDAEKNRR